VKKAIVVIVVVIVGIAVIGGVMWFRANRLTPGQIESIRIMDDRLEEAEEVEAGMEDADAEPEAIGEAAERAAADTEPQPEETDMAEAATPDKEALLRGPDPSPEPAPDTYNVRFETSKGAFTIQVHRDWAPKGADRFHELVEKGFYNDVRFFRVVKQPRPFVVQFGISGDPEIAAVWRNATIEDDPVVESNRRGTVTFATAGPDSRTTQIFVNLGNNANLDNMGFSPFGEVIEGMDVVEAFNSQYGDAPTRTQAQMQRQGNAVLAEAFPNLDYVERAYIVEATAEEGAADEEASQEGE
jgi:peptidyl-prolyl cis-trans isomerase A (cyclophilin A)